MSHLSSVAKQMRQNCDKWELRAFSHSPADHESVEKQKQSMFWVDFSFFFFFSEIFAFSIFVDAINVHTHTFAKRNIRFVCCGDCFYCCQIDAEGDRMERNSNSHQRRQAWTHFVREHRKHSEDREKQTKEKISQVEDLFEYMINRWR